MKKKHPFLLLSSLALLMAMPLVACKPEKDPIVGKSINSLMGKKIETEARLSTKASVAIAQGKTDEALTQYEKLYAKNQRDADIALNYAQLLRKTGKADRAVAVLAPFLTDKNGTPLADAPPLIINEYAACNIALGNFDSADKYLDGVLSNKNATDVYADTYNLKGIVLDATGNHKEAEKMFRDALESWKGDPTSVMNNLALSLANQSKFDESLDTLRRALVLAPNKQEIAGNIKLVSDLRDSVVKKPVSLIKTAPAPKSNVKPLPKKAK